MSKAQIGAADAHAVHQLAGPPERRSSEVLDHALRSLRRSRFGGPIEYLGQALGGLRHPSLLRSGATVAEEHRPLPGDDMVANPTWEATRAISINAPPSEVWPWVEQMGYGRGGWYGWNPLEREDTGADVLLADRNRLKVGDILLDGPGCDATKGAWRVTAVEPPTTLALYTLRDPATGRELNPTSLPTRFIDCGWTFLLTAEGENGTRLLVRTRLRFGPRWVAIPLMVNPINVLGAGDTVMQRRLLEGIKTRAEPGP